MEATALEEIIKQKRAQQGIKEAEPTGARKLPAPFEARALSDEESAERERTYQDWERSKATRVLAESLRAVFSGRERYVKCSLANYDCCRTGEINEGQQRAVSDLHRVASEIDECIPSIVWFGPPGTGKDHLMAAMIHMAVLEGIRVRWVNGMDLFGEVRDRMSDDTKQESVFVSGLVAPKVLAISDPLPPSGELTQFQSAMLFRVIDGRYSRGRPTWVTANVQSAEEMERRMGTQAVDRLTDGALVIPCGWESYRRPRA